MNTKFPNLPASRDVPSDMRNCKSHPGIQANAEAVMRFKAVKHPRIKGYAIECSQGDLPGWITRNPFGWYRYKRDALARAQTLNWFEKANPPK